uniref:Uncharacterized protein n=1 Tax=Brevundimonas basaltis TaxID=472166 RepID=A0A7W8MEV7_9CAUL|nr:hypothetical protein [Brevundimonas basaltis]
MKGALATGAPFTYLDAGAGFLSDAPRSDQSG